MPVLEETLEDRLRKLTDEAARLRAEIAELRGNPFTGQIKDLLEQSLQQAAAGDGLPLEIPSMSSVARHFGVSQRTLHRRLISHGARWRDLWQSVWVAQAQRCLRAGMPIKDVGTRLGFTTGPAFFRSFRRATGMTPSQWRVHHEAGLQSLL